MCNSQFNGLSVRTVDGMRPFVPEAQQGKKGKGENAMSSKIVGALMGLSLGVVLCSCSDASDKRDASAKGVGSDGGVQLWENGPYWAECNVGASKPEDAGYYFWWGDTVGYKRNASAPGWVSVKDGKSFSFCRDNCPTYDKTMDQLKSAGYIDGSGNLVAKFDAATAHWGAAWRMPTEAEFSALISNCTTTWTTRNGVYGRLVTGKGAYASKSIFLPAAGSGDYSCRYGVGSYGYCWSSTSYSDDSSAWCLRFDSGDFCRKSRGCEGGSPVRPVRGFAK